MFPGKNKGLYINIIALLSSGKIIPGRTLAYPIKVHGPTLPGVTSDIASHKNSSAH